MVALRVLIIGDGDAERILRHLGEAGFSPECRCARNEAEAWAELADGPELVVVDDSRPVVDLSRVMERVGGDPPVVVLTTPEREGAALAAMRAGAADYVMQDRLGRLGVAAQRAIEWRGLRRCVESDDGSRVAEDVFRAVFEAAGSGKALLDPLTGRFACVNGKLCNMLGYTAAELRDTASVQLVHPDERAHCMAQLQRLIAGEIREYSGERRYIRKDGQPVWVQTTATSIRDPHGRPTQVVLVLQDITGRKNSEESLQRSHALLRAVTDNSADAIYVKNTEGKYLLANRALSELVGRPVQEILGRTDGELFEPQTAARIIAEDRRIMASGFTQVFEETHAAADGGRRTCISSRSPLRDEHGQVCGVIGISHDITGRKRMEDALRQSEERYRSLTLASSQVVWIASAAGEFMEGMERWRELTGQSPDAARGEGWMAVLHPHDQARVREQIAQALDAGRPFTIEYRVRAWDGGYRHIVNRGVPVFNAAGAVREWVGTCTDITQQKQAQALEQERNSLRSAVGAMEQVLGVVGHELRTPLAAARAMAEFLLETSPAAELHGYLRLMHGEITRMAGMVNDLLEVARLNSGTARWNWGRVDVGEACEAALRTVRPLIDAARVELTLDVEPGLKMRGDVDAIRRLVLNLANNSGKFTDGGAIRVKARTAGDGWITIEVMDTGRGMSAETAARLGEAFALNAGMVGDNYVRGAGLGLAICKGIVAAHGGTICVDSAPGRGTRVVAQLRADLAQPVQETGGAHIIRRLSA